MNIRQIISNYGCADCHPNSGNLTVSYATMINVKAGEATALNYVTPGDPGHSYFWCKINPTDADCSSAGTVISGSRMPLGGPFLSAADLATVKTWIQQGAAP